MAQDLDREERYEVVNSTITGTVTVVLPAPGPGRHYVIFEADGYLKGGVATDIEMNIAVSLNFDPKYGASGFPAGGARGIQFRSRGLRCKENAVMSINVTNANGAADATVCRLRVQYTIRTTTAPVEAMQSGVAGPVPV